VMSGSSFHNSSVVADTLNINIAQPTVRDCN
jgi:hypothetical protein